MSSAAITIAYANRASKRRGSPHASASSLAAEAAIRDLKDGRRRRRGADDDPQENGLSSGVSEFAAKALATVDSLGVPRWVFPALVLGGVGLVLAAAVVNTLPLLARHAAAGTATFNGKPLGGVMVGFQPLNAASASEPRVVRTAADGSFQIAADEGLPPGIYAITVRPGESGVPIPPNYRSPETSPLRFEIREDLSGMQIAVRDGKQPVRKGRR